MIEYYITGGNKADVFVLDPHTGLLSVSSVDDLLDSYELALRVTDGKYADNCTVHVRSIYLYLLLFFVFINSSQHYKHDKYSYTM